MNTRTIALALLLAAAPAGIASACPNCKASIPTGSSEKGADLPSGFNHSVYLLLGSFLAVGGSVVGLVVKEARQTTVAQRNRNRRDRKA